MVSEQEVGETISFVAQEMLRLQRLGTGVRGELSGLDFLCSIYDAEGGMRLIGRPAYERLRELTTKAVYESEYRGRLDLQRTFKCVRNGFGRDYIRPDFPGSTDADDLRNFLKWINEAASECRSLTHYIPCHIRVPKGERIVVGPVAFEPRDSFLAEIETKLNDWVVAQGENDEWRANDRNTVLEYLGSFSDVACVTIQHCDADTSRRAADETVRAALAFLHILAGADRTSKVRSGGPAVRDAGRSTIAFDSEGGPSLTLTGDWEGARLDKTFWRWLRADEQQRMIEAVGKALRYIADRVDPPMVAARYLDAAGWYADAATEIRRPAAIVKYLTAMERLLWTGEHGGVTRRLSSRAAALCFTIDPWNFEELTEEIRRAYALRSDIVHGRIHNDDPKIARNYWLCDRVSRDLIVTWLRRYGDGFDRETTVAKLKTHLDGFVAEVTEETKARRAAG